MPDTITIEILGTYFQAGLHSFNDASLEYQQAFFDLLCPPPNTFYSDAQYEWLSARYLILPSDRVNELEEYHANSRYQVAIRETLSGELLINSDSLTACGEGQTFSGARDLLQSLKVRIASPDEFPSTDVEV